MRDQNAYQKVYQLRRYHKRRSEAIDKLGGKCVKCGSETDLEIDHVDPAQKTISLGKMWGVAEKLYQEELSKCQLLCQTCHSKKSVYDIGNQPRKHGSLRMYDVGCRCAACKSKKRANNKIHTEKRRQKRASSSSG